MTPTSTARSRGPAGFGVSKPVESACSCVNVMRSNVSPMDAWVASMKVREATNSPLLAESGARPDTRRRPLASYEPANTRASRSAFPLVSAPNTNVIDPANDAPGNAAISAVRGRPFC